MRSESRVVVPAVRSPGSALLKYSLRAEELVSTYAPVSSMLQTEHWDPPTQTGKPSR